MNAITQLKMRHTLRGVQQTARARQFLVVRAKQSGFGDGEGSKSSQKKKTSKRGKVSSRQDPNVQLRNNIKEFEEAAKAAGNQLTPSPSYPDNVVDVDLDSSSDTVPEVVTNRMLKRIAIFAGSPVLLGMMLFPLFYYVRSLSN